MDQRFYEQYYELEDQHWWFRGRRRIFIALLDRELGTRATGRRVLDVGCGTGAMLGHLARYGEVDGVEMSAEAVGLCGRRGQTRVTQATGHELPFPDASFDLVTALDVIEHIEDDRSAVEEMVRVLRPGGYLLLAVPAFRFLWGPQDDISHHFRRYRARELERRATEAGLVPRRVSYFNMVLFPAIATIRLLRFNRMANADRHRSDFELNRSSGMLNSALARLFGLESYLVARRKLPFGVSVLCLATKPDDGAA